MAGKLLLLLQPRSGPFPAPAIPGPFPALLVPTYVPGQEPPSLLETQLPSLSKGVKTWTVLCVSVTVVLVGGLWES